MVRSDLRCSRVIADEGDLRWMVDEPAVGGRDARDLVDEACLTASWSSLGSVAMLPVSTQESGNALGKLPAANVPTMQGMESMVRVQGMRERPQPLLLELGDASTTL